STRTGRRLADAPAEKLQLAPPAAGGRRSVSRNLRKRLIRGTAGRLRTVVADQPRENRQRQRPSGQPSGCRHQEAAPPLNDVNRRLQRIIEQRGVGSNNTSSSASRTTVAAAAPAEATVDAANCRRALYHNESQFGHRRKATAAAAPRRLQIDLPPIIAASPLIEFAPSRRGRTAPRIPTLPLCAQPQAQPAIIMPNNIIRRSEFRKSATVAFAGHHGDARSHHLRASSIRNGCCDGPTRCLLAGAAAAAAAADLAESLGTGGGHTTLRQDVEHLMGGSR
uniref:Uncharacterized protein n=1 Tax=Macrostomum lignano TaxID=282301 RepID=A0A1I8FBF6_9PLAT